MITLTADDIRQELSRLAFEQGSQKALADKIGCSYSYISEIIGGTREPAGPVLEWLKLERLVRYVPVNGKSLTRSRKGG